MMARLPQLLISPVYNVLQVATSRDKVRVVLDQAGLGHVIVASTERNDVLHIVVGAEGVLTQEVIRSTVAPWNVDAAFDQMGHLHVLIDEEHLVQQDDLWHKVHITPWQAAGFALSACRSEVGAPAARFVQGAADLVWAFTVKNEDIGAPSRWDWFGFGGGPAGIVWPWPAGGSKLLIVSGADVYDANWRMLDPQDNLDACNWQLATDALGTVTVVYDATRTLFVMSSMARYAQFPVGTVLPTNAGGAGPPTDLPEGKVLGPVTGQDFYMSIFDPEEAGPRINYNGLGAQVGLAADPVTGLILLAKAHGASWLLRDGLWSRGIKLPLKEHWFDPRLAAAGNERFHAVVTGGAFNEAQGAGLAVNYLAFVEGAWSPPVEVGRAEVSSIWGHSWDATQIGSNGGHKALVVWPTENAIVARWVVLQAE